MQRHVPRALTANISLHRPPILRTLALHLKRAQQVLNALARQASMKVCANHARMAKKSRQLATGIQRAKTLYADLGNLLAKVHAKRALMTSIKMQQSIQTRRVLDSVRAMRSTNVLMRPSALLGRAKNVRLAKKSRQLATGIQCVKTLNVDSGNWWAKTRANGALMAIIKMHQPMPTRTALHSVRAR